MASSDVTIHLPDAYRELLARVAQQHSASEEATAEALLQSAILNAAMTSEEAGELLDSIPGALERAKAGMEQFEHGEYVWLDELC